LFFEITEKICDVTAWTLKGMNNLNFLLNLLNGFLSVKSTDGKDYSFVCVEKFIGSQMFTCHNTVTLLRQGFLCVYRPLKFL